MTTLTFAGNGESTSREIKAATLTLDQAGGSELVVVVARDPSTAPLFAPYSRVNLSYAGGVRFSGWCDKAPATLAGTSRRIAYTLTGPWRWLEIEPYLPIASLDESGTPVRSEVSIVRTCRASGAPITLRAMITDILDFAVASSQGAIAYTIPEGMFEFHVPSEIRTDDTPGTILRSLLGFAPDTAMRWTYSSGAPTLEFVHAGTEPVSHTLTPSALTQVSPIEPLYDMLRGRVTVAFRYSSSNEIWITRPPAGDANALGAPKSARYSFDLGPGTPLDEEFVDNITGWAQRLHIACTASFRGFSWTRLPGDQWTFSTRFGAAGRRATCQRISRDLLSRRETITLGPPNPPTLISSRSQKSGPEEPEDSGGHPFALLDVTASEVTPTIRVVWGTVNGLAPAEMHDGDDPPYTFTPTAAGVVYVAATIDNTTGYLDTLSISHAASLPSDTDLTFHMTLGSYDRDGSTISIAQGVSGSLAFAACRDFYSDPPAWRPFWGSLA